VNVLDPEILAARKRQAEAFPAIDPTALPSGEARRLMNAAALFFSDGGPPLPMVRDVAIPGPAGPIGGRLYGADAAGGAGALLFIHGGGWFNCNLDTHDRICRLLARDSGRIVLAIDYRLAPEHRFPAALEDSLAAWSWLNDHAADLGVEPADIAVGGDSAGGNVALALALSVRDGGGAQPSRLALAYGCFAPVFDTASHLALGDGRVGLSTERMRWYWRNYIGPNLDQPPPLAAPSLADLHGLPPVYLCYAELDVLSDESRILAPKLAAAGVAHVLEGWPGAPHGFMQMTRDSALARAAVAKMAAFLKTDSAP
jgi:acetyl esterase